MSVETPTDTVTSVEHDGRVYSGVGEIPATLQAHLARTLETREPTTPAEPPAPTAADSAAPGVSSGELPKEPRGRRRFADLVFEREEAKRQADAVAKERDEWKAKFEAASKQPAASGAPQMQAPQAASQPQPSQPPMGPEMPAPLRTYEAFLAAFPGRTYEDFNDARQDWRAAALHAPQFDAQIRSRIEADRASRTHAERLDAIRQDARRVYADFDAVMTSGPGARIDLGKAKYDYVIAHPQARHLAYAIAKDGALAQRLASADPFAFALEVAKIAPDSSVASSATTGVSGSATPPSPMQPVGTGSATTSPTSADLVKGYDFDKSGYREKRAAERGVRRR
jgi:hypothetical protein